MKSILANKPPKIVAGVLNGDISILIFKQFSKDYHGWVYLYCAKGTNKHCLFDFREFEQDPDKFGCGKADKYYREKYKLLNGKVVARFYCDDVEEIEKRCYQENMFGGYYEALGTEQYDTERILNCSGLTFEELYIYVNYIFAKKPIYGYIVHISQLEIFDKPKELSELYSSFRCKRHNRMFANNSVEYDEKTKGLRQPTRNGYEWAYPLTKAPKGWQYVEE